MAKRSFKQSPLPPVGGSRSSFAGVVKVNYTGLVLDTFTAAVFKEFDLSSATAVVAPKPTTTVPRGANRDYDPGFYKSATDRLREAGNPGQISTWRVIGEYRNKQSGNNGALEIEMYNPDSGFIEHEEVTLPDGKTSGNFSFTYTIIADNESLPKDRGYKLRCAISFQPSTMEVEITSIARISNAVEVQ